MVSAAPPARLVPAVDRAARMLAFLEEERRPLGISDIARRLNASKGSVRDVLETLRAHGLLERDAASKQYRLGARLVRLGVAARGRLDLLAVARSPMQALAEETGETVLLFGRQGDRLAILAKAESERGASVMRVSATVGRRIPLTAGACGKVFLAYADAAEQDRSLEHLPRYTDRTIAEPTTMARELERVRAVGHALDDQEYLEGVRAASAPVLDERGTLVAALLTLGLGGSFTAERLAPVAEATARAAARISAALGAPAEWPGVSGECSVAPSPQSSSPGRGSTREVTT